MPKNTQASERRELQTWKGVGLIFLSVIGAGVGYATSVVAARLLGADGFEDYAVAVASLALLSTIAEAGTGKYALRVVPTYLVRAQWGLALGYWRFSDNSDGKLPHPKR